MYIYIIERSTGTYTYIDVYVYVYIYICVFEVRFCCDTSFRCSSALVASGHIDHHYDDNEQLFLRFKAAAHALTFVKEHNTVAKFA